MRRAPAGHQAFGETADPAAYVPRNVTEKVLERLECCVLDAAGPVVLTAAPGMGKSLLLRLLAERLEERLSPVFLAYGAMAPEQLCSWILGLVAKGEGEDPVDALKSYARGLRLTGRALLVLIDDADSLPRETARMVGAWLRESEGDIRPVLAAPEDARGEQVLAALGSASREVRLSEPMSARETRVYVEYQLERAEVEGDVRERFDPRIFDWIFRLSGGVPRLVQELALRVIDPRLGEFEAEWSAEALEVQGEGVLGAQELHQP